MLSKASNKHVVSSPSVANRYPAPVHTIGLTDQYIVMIQIPYPLNWVWGLDSFKWRFYT